LVQCEEVIQRGIGPFVEVGTALLKIRDGRLYRAEFGTFEDYCRERWGFGGEHARRLMRSAEVVQNLRESPPMGGLLPANEKQARPLNALEPDQQREAWQRAVDTAPDGRITAGHVQRVVDEMTRPDEPETDEYQNGTYDYSLPPTPMRPPDVQAEPARLAVHFSSATPEHYTPREIIDAVIDCMGEITLDPCSNSHDAPNVSAAHHFTAEDDGLAQQWFGKVFMNPPYGKEIAAWVDKLCDEYEHGNVEEAIALVPARTDTQWFARMRDYTVCFVIGRLTFGGNDDPAPFPSALVYMGSNVDAFWYSFCEVGDIWQRLTPERFGA
jgi:phage N-6-adenine-methyltransferase